MNKDLIEFSLKTLEWKPPSQDDKLKSCLTELDETVLLAFLRSVVIRYQGNLELAKEIMENEVLSVDKVLLKEESWIGKNCLHDAESHISEY